MIVAVSTFFTSLVLLGLLYTLKHFEMVRGVAYAPFARSRADDAARALKRQIERARMEISRLPPLAMYVTRFALHELALAAARLAKVAESQMHRVADTVSHKRAFEKREPRSEFLKRMNEHKNGNDSGLDTK